MVEIILRIFILVIVLSYSFKLVNNLALEKGGIQQNIIAILLVVLLGTSSIYFELSDYILEYVLFFSAILLISSIYLKEKLSLVYSIGIVAIALINLQNITFCIVIIFQKYYLGVNNNAKFNLFYLVVYIILIIIWLKMIIKNRNIVYIKYKKKEIFINNISLIIIYMINLKLLNHDYYVENFSEINIFLFLFSIVGVFTSYLMISYSEYRFKLREMKEEKLLLDQIIKEQANHHTELEKHYNDVVKIKHDMNNHNNIISALIKKNEYKKLEDYIRNIDKVFNKINNDILLCDNKIIDAICVSKKAICKKKNINIYFDIEIRNDISVDDLDLCIIYGNLLDNAIEACERIKDDSIKKVIKIESRILNDFFMIKVENSNSENVVIKNNKFITLKHDKKFHGIGLDNVRRSIKKYNGELILKDKKDIFISKLIMKI
ncbi:sensor histidine kinase [Clostridium sardiniense]|uniref:sensor histidine kinase n=1 Tax=Clostridium sardiniense TaxID=29369 RepID=UPI003D332DE6